MSLFIRYLYIVPAFQRVTTFYANRGIISGFHKFSSKSTLLEHQRHYWQLEKNRNKKAALARTAYSSMANTQSIVKPSTDKRDYKYLQLTNQLKVLLISDPSAYESAVALDVNVGSAQEPWNLNGLAHFLEHMLFLGSSKFPNESEYSSFIAQHSGKTNAYTDKFHTNYQFTISPQYLNPSMDRFAQFFISPLMDQDSTDREIQAVDHESSLRKLQEITRLVHMFKYTANEAHPENRFAAGNIDTLKRIPEMENIDTRKELINFYDSFYSSNRMALAVLGKESLPDLEKLVLKHFSSVKNKKVPDLITGQIAGSTPLYKSSQMKKLVYIEPMGDTRMVCFTFPMLPYLDQWKEKPLQYVSYILGNEGKGSLLTALKNEELVSALFTHIDENESGTTFHVIVNVTEKGSEESNLKIIGNFLMKYINLIKSSSVQKSYFDEIQMLSKMQFEYQDLKNQFTYISLVARQLHYYPRNEILAGPYLLYKYDEDMIKSTFNSLDIENMIVYVCNMNIKDKCTDAEPIYDIKYKSIDLPQDLFDSWNGILKMDKTKIDEACKDIGFHLPLKNVYVPHDLTLKPLGENHVKETSLPQLMNLSKYLNEENKFTRLFFLQDDKFFVPKANIFIWLYLPYAVNNLEKWLLMNLYFNTVNAMLQETYYDATVAELSASIETRILGSEIQVVLTGFNDKMDLLLKTIIKAMKNHENLNEERFNVVKDEYMNRLKNELLYGTAHSQAVQVAKESLVGLVFSIEDKIQVLSNLTFDMVKKCGETVLHNAFIETYIHGNFSTPQAIDLHLNILSELDLGRRAERTLDEKFVLDLRKLVKVDDKNALTSLVEQNYDDMEGDMMVMGNNFLANNGTGMGDKRAVRLRCRKENSNHLDTNTFSLLYVMLGDLNMRDTVKLNFVSSWLGEPFFDRLRTEQQLGYHVSCHSSKVFLNSTLSFNVASSYSADYTTSRIEEFIEDFLVDDGFDRNLNESLFLKFKESLATELKIKPENMPAQAMRYCREIYTMEYEFERHEKYIKELESLTRDEIREFVSRLLKSPWVLVQVTKKDSELPQRVSGTNYSSKVAWIDYEIDDIKKLVKSNISINRN